MSTHNVEVYRCRACGDKVVTVGAGIGLSKEDLKRYTEEHRQDCTAPLERIIEHED